MWGRRMEIVQLETITLDEFPNIAFVQLSTDDGAFGLGETFFGAHEVVTYLHQTAAPRLLGRDAASIEAIRVALKGYIGTRGTGVEARGNSAIDIALWDLLGKATGRAIYELLGGASRTAVRVYNTCAGYSYIRRPVGRLVDSWGVPQNGATAGPYEDLRAWSDGRAGELAESLLEQGITGMKMWPFDPYAEASG